MLKKIDCVSNDVAKLLKNKNINIKSERYFIESDKTNYNEVWDDGQMMWIKKYKINLYYTPTLYDVQQYFIKKYNILIVISNNEYGFYWFLHRANDGQIIELKDIQETGGYKFYQNAFNEAINYILKNNLNKY